MNEETEHAPNLEAQPTWYQLLKTTEGSILLLGVAVGLIGLIVIGISAFGSPPILRMIAAMSLTNIIFGWVASMSIGYAGGYGHALVVPVNLWVETVLVLVFYPLFVFSMRHLVVFRRLKRILDRTRAAAERQQDKVRSYGIVGLLIFVWLPFWMTGPVVGAAIGYLLGFPAWMTVSIVLVGTYIAMLGWAYLLLGIFTHVADFGPWVSVINFGILILIVLVGYWLHRQGED